MAWSSHASHLAQFICRHSTPWKCFTPFQSWRMTESNLNQLSTFHTNSLRRILQIFWPKTISKQHLTHCNQDSMDTIIMRRRWRWIGHVIRRVPSSISHTALHWTLEEKRKRVRPKNTWRRTVEGELKTLHHTWGTVQKLAQNRKEWSTFVATLHASQHNGHEWVSDTISATDDGRAVNYAQIKVPKTNLPLLYRSLTKLASRNFSAPKIAIG